MFSTRNVEVPDSRRLDFRQTKKKGMYSRLPVAKRTHFAWRGFGRTVACGDCSTDIQSMAKPA
jgi:hypothetical protein